MVEYEVGEVFGGVSLIEYRNRTDGGQRIDISVADKGDDHLTNASLSS